MEFELDMTVVGVSVDLQAADSVREARRRHRQGRRCGGRCTSQEGRPRQRRRLRWQVTTLSSCTRPPLRRMYEPGGTTAPAPAAQVLGNHPLLMHPPSPAEDVRVSGRARCSETRHGRVLGNYQLSRGSSTHSRCANTPSWVLRDTRHGTALFRDTIGCQLRSLTLC
jgi:hypothetical protein